MPARRGSRHHLYHVADSARGAVDRTRRYEPTASEDLFSVNPLKRSAIISGGCWSVLLVPGFLMHGDLQALILISFGWLAAVGIIFVTPIFFWCVGELIWDMIRQRLHPSVEQLDLSPRALSLLRRFGYDSIESVEATPDAQLLLHSNMDARTVREIRRAISIWRYQRWQEQGFPAHDMP